MSKISVDIEYIKDSLQKKLDIKSVIAKKEKIMEKIGR